MEHFVTFTESTTKGAAYKASSFLGAEMTSDGVMTLHFENRNNTATSEAVTVTTGNGHNAKRGCMAIANGLRSPKVGKLVNLGNVLTGEYVKVGSSAISAVTTV